MSTPQLRHRNGILYPEDLQRLQRLFDDMCAERKIDRKSPEANGLAVGLIAVYQRRLKDETLIKSKLAA
jgi:hypothetical protein